MKSSDAPGDGDFASYLEGRKQGTPAAPEVATCAGDNGGPPQSPRQTIQQVLVEGEEPTEEFLEEWNALQDALEVSDEELARQALGAPGEEIPTGACLFFHGCAECGFLIAPKAGDCCVSCSYGSVQFPPVRESGGCCSSAETRSDRA